MNETIKRVESYVDQSGQVSLPRELQERLEPGVALVVETRQNDTIALRIQRVATADTLKVEPLLQPHLIDKGGLLGVRGEVSANFQWETSLAEREAPLHALEPSTA
jgi:hypothetical protein